METLIRDILSSNDPDHLVSMQILRNTFFIRELYEKEIASKYDI
jgi:hypothetical protein